MVFCIDCSMVQTIIEINMVIICLLPNWKSASNSFYVGSQRMGKIHLHNPLLQGCGQHLATFRKLVVIPYLLTL